MTEETTMTLAEFIKAEQIEMSVVRLEARAKRGSNDQWEKTARHFSCTLKQVGKGNPNTLTIEFSQGSAHTKNPTAADVLNCLKMDASSYDDARDFEDWCNNYGYSEDSREAERIYRDVAEQAKQLRQFIGNPMKYQELMDCESL